ncbi:LCP family protein [uncultured Ruminococcus sp.]|uniref:LCP family glycopolymer transferase n=1 Tax=uncultured Ruminococcus sp. TaxID=165186 RepID=UPI0025CF0EE3|nr:LCP family protein [uncultured Ruminococcus sp.]
MAQAAAAKNRRRRKKRRSQAPVALIYFLTLLIFLALFGMFARYLMNRLNTKQEDEIDYSETYIDSYNTLYARVNGKNVLSDLFLMRICPEQGKMLFIPLSAFTVSSSDGATFREVYADGGIRKLKESVDETLGISTDYYCTLSNQSFEDIIDIIGGFLYAPEEELYHLSADDGNDISLRANKAVTLSGKQVRLICQTNIFSKGRQGNTEFLGQALVGVCNNAFDQIEITTNSLDIIYGKISASSSTNITENDFKQHKTYIKEMLKKQLQPAYSMVPEGQWAASGDSFTISPEFKQKIYDEMEATKSSQKSGIITKDE